MLLALVGKQGGRVGFGALFHLVAQTVRPQHLWDSVRLHGTERSPVSSPPLVPCMPAEQL